MNRALIVTLSIIIGILLFDSLLPTNKMEVNVHHIDKPDGNVIYIVPESGGGIGSCSAEEEVLRKLQPHGAIVIETTAILNRCTAQLPSWPIDVDKFVENAIRVVYHNVYSTLEELREDYPGFTPHVSLWGESYWFMPQSFRRYSVQLPEELVILDPDGEFQTTRPCGSTGSDCELVAPFKSEKGIVGTVQYGAPDYAIANDFYLEWSGDSKATFFKSGHCFSAYSQSNTSHDLVVRLKDATSMQVRVGYGFFLVAGKGDGFSVLRISREEFTKSRFCSSQARDEWPNVGGYAWKR